MSTKSRNKYHMYVENISSPDSKSGLKEGDDARDEEHGGDDVGLGGVAVLHAHGRAHQERHRQRRPEHGQVMLRRRGGFRLEAHLFPG